MLCPSGIRRPARCKRLPAQAAHERDAWSVLLSGSPGTIARAQTRFRRMKSSSLYTYSAKGDRAMGYRLLAFGCRLLAIGYWLSVSGRPRRFAVGGLVVRR